MNKSIEKIVISILWIVGILIALILSPLIIVIVLLFLIRAIIVEMTQEYRCMGCGTWIPKAKRKPGEIVHWCSKDCYLDR